MSSVASQTPMKNCILCAKPLPEGAMYCTECESFQDKVWRLRFSKESLPMIVALVAVIGAVAPPIIASLHKSDAVLIVSQVHSTRITVTNLGDAPGVVNAIRVDWGIDKMPLIAGTGGGSLVNELLDPVVRPGETRSFDLSLPSSLGSQVNWAKVTNPLEMPCRITVLTTSARQVEQHQPFYQATCGVLLNLWPGDLAPSEPPK